MATLKFEAFIYRGLCAGLFLLATVTCVLADQLIRVAILSNVKSFDLSVNGRFEIIDSKTGARIGSGNRQSRLLVTTKSDQTVLAGHSYDASKITIRPYIDATVLIGHRRFRGDIEIIRDQSNLTVVNHLNVEDYTKGVLYHEISHEWPMEAMKSQAVVTRTYALYQKKQRVKYDFDLTNDIYSQVYGGKTSEHYRTNLAVEQTEGDVLTYHQELFPTFFHSASIVITEDATELWNVDIPPLDGGVKAYDSASPHRHWKRNLRLKDIQDALNANGYSLGLIKDIAVVERNKSGRIRELKITTRDGKSAAITGKKFREIVGPNIIRSNNYEIVMQGYYVDLIGQGWGHGVGMSQWGALGMSKEHFNYKQILAHFYPQSQLTNIK